MNNKLEQVVILCLKRVIGDEEVSADTSLLEAGMNSMSFVRLVVELEDELNMEIHDEDIDLENFVTVEKICSVVKKYFVED